MIDFRYHLASLMAVFLALGIGILIGNSFVGLASVEPLEPQMKRLQRDVQEKIEAGQQENAALKQEVLDDDRGVRALAPRAVRGLLAGRRVALVLIEKPKRPETVTELSNLLADAGATVASTTVLNRKWLPSDAAARNQALGRLEVQPGADELMGATRGVARGISTGDWSGALHDVAGWAPGLHLSGDYTAPVGAVVLVTSPGDSAEPIDGQAESVMEGALLGVWKASGLRVVAGESATAPTSMVSFFRDPGIATVDDIDTAIGEVACAMAIVAGIGNYGVKATADRILPDLPLKPAPGPEISGPASEPRLLSPGSPP